MSAVRWDMCAACWLFDGSADDVHFGVGGIPVGIGVLLG